MFARIKNIVVTVTKTIITPTIFSIGSTVSSAGSALFGTERGVDYIANGHRHNAKVPISITAIVASVASQIATRVPPIFKQFSSNHSAEPENDIEDQQPASTSWCHIQFDERVNKLGAKGKFTYFSFALLSHASNVFSTLSSFLGAITLAEFVANEFDINLEDENWKRYAVNGFAFYIATSNFVSFYAFNYQKSKMNGLRNAEYLENKNKNALDKTAVAKTFSVAFFNVASAPFLAYFGTSNALKKIPYIKNLNLGNKIISGVSAFTYLTSTMTTYVPSMYDYLTRSKPVAVKEFDHSCALPLRASVYTLGLVDSIRIGVTGNGLGVIATSHDVFGTDLYNPYIMTAAGLSAVSTTTLNMVFSVREAYNDVVLKSMQEDDLQPQLLHTGLSDTDGSEDSLQIKPKQLHYKDGEFEVYTKAGFGGLLFQRFNTKDSETLNPLINENDDDCIIQINEATPIKKSECTIC